MIVALRQVWTEIGLDVADEERELDRQLQEFYQYKLMDANNTKSQFLDEIAAMKQDIDTFAKQLGEPFKGAEAVVVTGQTLKQQVALLRTDHSALKKVVDERTAALSVFLKELTYIQALMGENPQRPPEPLDLTFSGFDAVKEDLRVKKIEQMNRRKAIQAVALEYRALLEALQLDDLTDFDRSIATNVEALGLSLNLIELISNRIVELTKIEMAREDEKKSLVDQIQPLWDRFKISRNAQDEFLEANKGISTTNLTNMRQELEKLMELKRERLAELLADVRGQIETLWTNLECAETARMAFGPFHEEDVTEELLALHEEEVKRLDAKFTSRKAVLKYIEKREEILAERAQYEESLKDPERLIGRTRDTGRLLREEKLQAKIKHDLPKITKLLSEKLPAWEVEYGVPFVVQGERYMDTMIRVDTEYAKQKELEKQEKERLKREKKMQAVAGAASPAIDDKLKLRPKLTKRMSAPNQQSMQCAPSPVLHNAVALSREGSKSKLVSPEM
ncbi:unnamed protein product [Aphanomyces euteiches]|nr:hypothetical protein AeRB84_001158 [Aphanomyces euteiches]